MSLKDYYFRSDSGDLFDTRDPDWTRKPPLRVGYALHSRDNREKLSVSEVKAAIRAGDRTDLGGYPLYFITKDGESLSFEGAKQDFADIVRGFTMIIGVDINYEDSECFCCVTGKQIPAAYADETTSEEG